MKKNSLQGELSVAKRVRFCDYNCTDSYGWTPLEIAAVLGHAPLVRYFSEAGVYLKTTKTHFVGGRFRGEATSKTIKECWRQ